MDSRVYIVPCRDYADADEKLAELFDLMGGVDRFVQAGEAIALKPNLLRAAAPEKVVSTHPAVVAAVGRAVKGAGGRALIVDSPGSGYRYSKKALARTYRVCAMDRAAEDSGAELNYDTAYEDVFHRDGQLVKRFEVITPLRKADGIINLAKLKTHMFTSMTGAVKNLFGAVPGLFKPAYHAKLPESRRFAGMLLDLARLLSPRLSIMDAVIAMEGAGPGAGKPKPVGLLLAATDPLALDVVASDIIGLAPEQNPLLAAARARGVEPHHIGQVEVVGAELDAVRVTGLELPKTVQRGTALEDPPGWQRALTSVFRGAMTVKPRVDPGKCVGCAACRDACPVEAISMINTGGKAVARIDDDPCIRCYCCHEMCPEDAVALHSSFLYRLVMERWAAL